jgi:hypothetical protein
LNNPRRYSYFSVIKKGEGGFQVGKPLHVSTIFKTLKAPAISYKSDACTAHP